ncbi:hypothetical protein QJS10_CPA01g01643 [Acorus calamus]|uniref:Uncharacterized protein n=1 Tax=Acorus calamus TaxID=4465 RepID=A0AAV9FKQ7_ACOCL|nr:hypothetical protein QJS10_CPA01g01627 [Acorus calamus]KAK1326819.1 hypothetical protein QJS10_CPA01g01643 [Acorus calamus]
MASQSIDNHRANAKVIHGDLPCKKRIVELLEELCLPKGLFPLDDVQEYDRSLGFMWLTHKKKKDHVFKKIKQTVSYATGVTAIVENLAEDEEDEWGEGKGAPSVADHH